MWFSILYNIGQIWHKTACKAIWKGYAAYSDGLKTERRQREGKENDNSYGRPSEQHYGKL